MSLTLAFNSPSSVSTSRMSEFHAGSIPAAKKHSESHSLSLKILRNGTACLKVTVARKFGGPILNVIHYQRNDGFSLWVCSHFHISRHSRKLQDNRAKKLQPPEGCWEWYMAKRKSRVF